MKIDKTILQAELIESAAQDKWTKQLTAMMQQLAKGVSQNRCFRFVPDKEDMVQDGLLHLLTIWKKFDCNHPSANPFGYFTQSLFRHYSKYFTSEVERNKVITLTNDGEFHECN